MDIYAFANGREPLAKKCGKPLKVEKDRELDCPLELPEEA